MTDQLEVGGNHGDGLAGRPCEDAFDARWLAFLLKGLRMTTTTTTPGHVATALAMLREQAGGAPLIRSDGILLVTRAALCRLRFAANDG